MPLIFCQARLTVISNYNELSIKQYTGKNNQKSTHIKKFKGNKIAEKKHNVIQIKPTETIHFINILTMEE